MTSLLDASFAPHFARTLLEIGAVQINTKNPYTWASGKKFPIYCDNRRLLSHPFFRAEVKRALIESIKRHFATPQAIAAVATAGLPYGVLVADELGLPFMYVRSKAKAHGLGKQIEGHLLPAQKILLFDDLVSTGRSALDAAAVLEAEEQQLIGTVALFSYGLPSADKAFRKAGLLLYVLCGYEELLKVALEKKYISFQTKTHLDQLFLNE